MPLTIHLQLRHRLKKKKKHLHEITLNLNLYKNINTSIVFDSTLVNVFHSFTLDNVTNCKLEINSKPASCQ